MPINNPTLDALLPRGMRNYNPGNIENGAFARSQPGYVGSDGRFAKFDNMDNGLAAHSALLNSYGNKGLNTLNAIINRWAPSSDNNRPAQYAAFVGKKLGVDPNQPLDMSDPNVRKSIATAMGTFENGMSPTDPRSWQASGNPQPATGTPMQLPGATQPSAQPQQPTAQSISLGDQENQQPLNNIGSTLANMGAAIASLDRHGTGIASLNASHVANNLAAQEAAREKEGGWKYAGQTQNGQGLMFQNSKGEIRVEPLSGQFAGEKEPEQLRTLRAIAADPDLTKAYSTMHGGAATLSTEAIKNAAARVRNGEKGVLNRMSQGNAAAIAEEVAAQTGEDPGQILQNQINATGKQAEARTIGTSVGKSAVSAGTFASGVTNALEASKKVGRGEFVPFNKAEQIYKQNTSDPDFLDFKASHETMIREYAKAINPNGNPTVSDMNHARELLSTATDEPAYNRVVARLQSEVANKQKNLENLNTNKNGSSSNSSSTSTKRLKYNPQTGELE